MSFDFRNFMVLSESVTPDLMRYMASEIHRWLTIGLKEWDVANGLYNLFRHTDTPDNVEIKRQAWQDKAEAYYYDLIRLKWPRGYVGEVTQSWFLVNRETRMREKERDRHRYYDIHHKLYFTVKAEQWDQILNFLRSLPDLANRLLAFTEDDVEFKVPTRISTLVTHADRLIVYYKDVKNRDPITHVVRRWMLDKKVGVDNRNIRASHGFDMLDPRGQDHSSHTQLVCRKVARQIAENETKFLHMNRDALANWLMSSFAHAAASDVDALTA
jgi:hypothetical protein